MIKKLCRLLTSVSLKRTLVLFSFIVTTQLETQSGHCYRVDRAGKQYFLNCYHACLRDPKTKFNGEGRCSVCNHVVQGRIVPPELAQFEKMIKKQTRAQN